jgi:hypothetical protein
MITLNRLPHGSGLINPGSFIARTLHGWTVSLVLFGRRVFLAYKWPNRRGFQFLWIEAHFPC